MLRERVGDLKDVEIRVLTLLLDLPDHDPVDLPKGANAILVTHDLTPSLTVQLDRSSDRGDRDRRRHAHVARRDSRAIARPAGDRRTAHRDAGADGSRDGDPRRLDGLAGDQSVALRTSTSYRERARQEELAEAELEHLATLDAVTTDGVRITLRANVDLPEEAELAAHSGAEGVGLMRTEFLVVGRATMPDEEEQYKRLHARREGVRRSAGRHSHVRRRRRQAAGRRISRPRRIRSSAGARSGCASISRSCSACSCARCCAPRCTATCASCCRSSSRSTRCDARASCSTRRRACLQARGVEFRRDVPLGVMIETPAAAVSCDTFVNDVAFFSIGTNDLVQYTLAVDRGNANLATRFTPLHPAVLKLIRRTVDTAHEYDLDVAVCGEMASQPLMAFALIGLGVRQLSVAPRSVPLVKRIVRGISVAAAEEAASAALAAATAAEAEAALRRRLAGMLGSEALFGEGMLE